MVNALILGREGTADPTQHAAYARPNTLPAVGNVNELERWEPWVRAYTVLGDLLSGIEFADASAAPERVTGLMVNDRTCGPIATIHRPSLQTFRKQLPLVLSWADLRYERANEILAQIDPQYAFWSSVLFIRPDRARWTMELINLTLQFCVYVEMRFKHALACWRPVELNPQVQPMISTPGHGSFPSGHATQAYAVAHVLARLVGLTPSYAAPPAVAPVTAAAALFEQLQRQAARISTNRVVAGVHFPVDSMAGRMLGVTLGEYLVARSGLHYGWAHRTFDASWIDQNASKDFNPFDPIQALDPQAGGAASPLYPQTPVTPPISSPTSPLLNKVWKKAQREWIGRIE